MRNDPILDIPSWPDFPRQPQGDSQDTCPNAGQGDIKALGCTASAFISPVCLTQGTIPHGRSSLAMAFQPFPHQGPGYTAPRFSKCFSIYSSCLSINLIMSPRWLNTPKCPRFSNKVQSLVAHSQTTDTASPAAPFQLSRPTLHQELPLPHTLPL